MGTPLQLSPGDVIAGFEDNEWSTSLILDLETLPDGSATAHCSLFKPQAQKPSMDSLPARWIGHAPILASSYTSESHERLGNRTLAPEDLEGYIYHLKNTHFPKYLSFTGQALQDVVSSAKEHYKLGYELTDQGHLEAALTEYEKAADLFPFFHEAIDNGAFVLMDLGRYQEALEGFEQSLRVNRDGITAFLSRGECLLKLGDISAAKAAGAEASQRFPEHRPGIVRLLAMIAIAEGK